MDFLKVFNECKECCGINSRHCPKTKILMFVELIALYNSGNYKHPEDISLFNKPEYFPDIKRCILWIS